MDKDTHMELSDVVFKSNVFSKQAVEGVMADVLVQIKGSLDVVMGLTQDPGIKKVDSIKSTFLITRSEVENCLVLLSAYSNASLSPKHRLARAILFHFSGRLTEMAEDIRSAKAVNSGKLTRFGEALVEFLTSYHRVLSDATETKHRGIITKGYCGYIPRANGDILH